MSGIVSYREGHTSAHDVLLLLLLECRPFEQRLLVKANRSAKSLPLILIYRGRSLYACYSLG
jgi:hypothetical protein